jgi:DNA-binding HxlR family transcriptional regulator
MCGLAKVSFAASILRIAKGGFSDQTVRKTLKDLEADRFVLRTAHPVVPPHVVYELTGLGREAAAHVVALMGWIEGALPEILAGQVRVAAE